MKFYLIDFLRNLKFTHFPFALSVALSAVYRRVNNNCVHGFDKFAQPKSWVYPELVEGQTLTTNGFSKKITLSFGSSLIFFLIYATNIILIHSMEKNDLIECIRNNKLKEMVELIENGADPNKECGYIITDKPIVFAAYQNNLEAVKSLLENKADINSQNDNGFTALIVATRNKSFALGEFLLSQNADTLIKNKHGSDALFWAEGEIKNLLERHNTLNSFIKQTSKTLKHGKKTSNIYDLITQRQISY